MNWYDRDCVSMIVQQAEFFPKLMKDINLRHKRLEHTSLVLSKLFPINLDSIKGNISKCIICPCAKLTRLPFQHSSIKSNAGFDLIHVDLWSPY